MTSGYGIIGAASDVGTLQLVTSSGEVKMMIDNLTKQFNSLKNTIRECLERQEVSRVADVLTSLSPDEDERHRIFITCHVSDLYRAANVFEVFGVMNFHWNYLDPSLFEHLVKEFNLVETEDHMEAYKSELKQFRMRTPLDLFCGTQKRKRSKLKPELREKVVGYRWPVNTTLEDMEQFRQEWASEYSLQECSMIINGLLIVKRFISLNFQYYIYIYIYLYIHRMLWNFRYAEVQGSHSISDPFRLEDLNTV